MLGSEGLSCLVKHGVYSSEFGRVEHHLMDHQSYSRCPEPNLPITAFVFA